jgi:iron complex outermembrane recepter protein
MKITALSRSAALMSASAAVLAVAVAGAAMAAEAPAGDTSAQVEEVVVTAQKRSENVQKVPIAVTAVAGDQLREQVVTSTVALGRVAPNLTVTDYGNPVITVFTLRGVSQFDFSDHQESPVAVFVDGSYVPYLSAVGANLFDLDHVEVLRGPQGTLFGRNATGGVIQVVSAKPTATPSGYAMVQAGNYGAIRAEGAVSGPIGGGVLGRLSLVDDQRHGYFHNTLGGSKGDGDDLSWRAQLYKDFDGKGDLTLMARGSRDRTSTSPYSASAAYPDPSTGLFVKGNGAAFADFCSSFFGVSVGADPVDCLSGDVSHHNRYTITANRKGGGFRRDYYNLNATLNLDLGTVKLTSITSYGHLRKGYSDEDSDGTSYDLLVFAQEARAEDFSQELRLAGHNGRFNWVVGAYALGINGDYSSDVSFFPGDPLFAADAANAWKLDDRTYAVFGQTEVELTDALKLIVGARYDHDHKTFDFHTPCAGPGCALLGFSDPSIVQGTGYDASVPGAQPVRNSDNWDGKLQLTWQATDNVMAYGGVSRGTKAGGYNAGSTAFYTVGQTIFADEVLTDYGVGLKSSWLDNRLRLNASVFYYDYDKVQVFSQLGPSTLTFNDDAKIYGAEFEMQARPTATLTLGANVSLLHSRLDPLAVPNVLTGTVAMVSQRFPNAPDATVSGYVRKEWPVGPGYVAVQADAKWQSSQKLNLIDYPATLQPAYALVNGRLSVGPADKRWEAAVYVQNIANQGYRVAAAPFVTTNGAIIEIYGPPRLVGVSLMAQF